MGNDLFEWLFEHVVGWLVSLLLIAFILLLIALPFMIYADSKAERFSLRKDAWECSASVQIPTTTYIQSGNVMVPMTTYSKHCTQWSERP
jgi:hypothetical protein